MRKRIVFDEHGKRTEHTTPTTNDEVGDHLKSLPSDYVTKDISDPDRIHKYDAPHIVDALAKERAKPKNQKKSIFDILRKQGKIKPHGRGYRLDPLNVDVIRFRVIQALVGGLMKRMELPPVHEQYLEKPDLSIHHIWFPEDNMDKYELRAGNPPADADRPPHLRGLDLEIDIVIWPKRIVDLLKQDNPNFQPPTASMMEGLLS